VPTAVLASGSGTILEAISTAGIGVELVAADRACGALEVAGRLGLSSVLVDRAAYGGFTKAFDRARYTEALSAALDASGIDLVCMAGFGTILDATFFERFGGRVLNTHPSLLPAFRGWHAVRDALAAGASVTGCTVHLATAELDDGPVLRQASVAVLPGDDEASLHERIKRVERVLYPETIALVRDALDHGADPSSVASQAVPAR